MTENTAPSGAVVRVTPAAGHAKSHIHIPVAAQYSLYFDQKDKGAGGLSAHLQVL